MIFKKRILRKMMLYFLGASLLVYVASLGYVGIEVKNISREMASTDIQQKSDDLANKVKGLIDSKAKIVESLALTMQEYESIEESQRRATFTKMLRNVIADNSEILSIWSVWEPNSIDSFDEENILADDGTAIGNYSPSFYRQGEEIKVEVNPNMPPYEKPYYTIPRDNMSTSLLDPYMYSYNIGVEDSILITSIIAPITLWGDFLGVVGIDFSLEIVQNSILSNSGNDDEQIYLISKNEKFIYNPDAFLVGQHQNLVADTMVSTIKDTMLIGKDLNNKTAIMVFKKIDIANNSWYLDTTVPVKTAYAQATKSFFNVILLILAGFILLSIVISMVARNISESIVNINNKLAGLSLGIIGKNNEGKKRLESEITDLNNALDNLFDSLQASVDFAGEIGKGNLNAEYHLLSDGDTLGESLITMQNSLIEAKKEEDKKKLLDDQRNWVTHGLANFGEIIRQDNNNVEDFALNLLSQLLQYVDIVQGAIYFKKEDQYSDEVKFENKAAIAYGKQIMLENLEVTSKDGIFGRTIDEMKCIYLEDIPDSYVSFTQGKKEAQKPRNLLVVPMIVNDEIYGIMELVSYNHIEQYKIEFIEKLCENIASVVSSVNTNIHNAHLLEQSNEQAEELSQHEEEMRQNLEEMQATQEEATKRHDMLNSQLMAFYKGLMVAEIDLDGNIVNISKTMMRFYGINNENVEGQSYFAVTAHDDDTRDTYKEFWSMLMTNGKAQRRQSSKIYGKDLSTLEYYKVIYKYDEPYRVIVVAINKTRVNELNERLDNELQAYMNEHGITDLTNEVG